MAVVYNVVVHIYQKNILDQLRQTPVMRYSQLQPDDVESSHFKYHLNQLIKDKLVEKKGRGLYGLTQAGQAAVDKLSSGRVNPHQTPKVITYTLLQDDDNYYLQIKDKEPYLGLLNMVGGKLHLGETPEIAAKREVKEKVGLELNNLVLKGVAQIKISQADNLLSHVEAFVFVGHVDENGTTDLEKVVKTDLSKHQDLAPDLRAVIDTIETGKVPFVVSLDIDWIKP